MEEVEMQKHILLTLGGVVVGMLALAWVQPNTGPGAVLLVVLGMLLFNGLGIIVSGIRRVLSRSSSTSPPAAHSPPSTQVSTPPARPRSKAKARLVPLALLIPLWPAVLSAQPEAERPETVVMTSPLDTLTSARRAIRVRSFEEARTSLSAALTQLRAFPPSDVRDRSLAALETAIEAVERSNIDKANDALKQAEEHVKMLSSIVVAQSTSGACSPVISGVGGNVTINSACTASFSRDLISGLGQNNDLVGNQGWIRRLVPARAFMRAADIPPSTVGAYGVLTLRAKPTPASLARLKMACASYLASLPEQNTLPSSVPTQDQMLTIWPLETAGKPEAKLDDCDHLLNNYDLHGGISAIQDADRQGNTLMGRGPYLIGWSPSNTRGIRDAVVLVIDMSPIDSQQSFDEMFLIWQKRIVENPELWRSGFSAERLRLALRDFVDRYGQSILDSVEVVRSGG